MLCFLCGLCSIESMLHHHQESSMKNAKIFASIFLASVLFLTQFSAVFAAPPTDKAASIAGTVTEVTLVTDPSTGIITVLVTVTDQAGGTHTVRIGEKTAAKLGLIDYDSADGNPFIVNPPPSFVEIDAKNILTDEERGHPVVTALATYFADIEGIDYDVIMAAHSDGFGFGLIAQSLWLIRKMGGTSEDFLLLLDAKKNNDFSDFPLDDGSTPASWGELKKAVADHSLGSIMSKRDKSSPGENPSPAGNPNANTNKNQDKNKDKPNNGNGNGNNGQGKGNGGNKP